MKESTDHTSPFRRVYGNWNQQGGGLNPVIGQSFVKKDRVQGVITRVPTPVPADPIHLLVPSSSGSLGMPKKVLLPPAFFFFNPRHYEVHLKIGLWKEGIEAEENDNAVFNSAEELTAQVVSLGPRRQDGRRIVVVDVQTDGKIFEVKHDKQQVLELLWEGRKTEDNKNAIDVAKQLERPPNHPLRIVITTKMKLDIRQPHPIRLRVQPNPVLAHRIYDAMHSVLERVEHSDDPRRGLPHYGQVWIPPADIRGAFNLKDYLLARGSRGRYRVVGDIPHARVQPFDASAVEIARAIYYERLDPSQKAVFDSVFEDGVPGGLQLVWGPPGTGKSTTSAVIIITLAMGGIKVGVCAESNAAVDALIEKVAQKAKLLPEDKQHMVLETIVRATSGATTREELRTGEPLDIKEAHAMQQVLDEMEGSNDPSQLSKYNLARFFKEWSDNIMGQRDSRQADRKAAMNIREGERGGLKQADPENVKAFWKAIRSVATRLLAGSRFQIIGTTLGNASGVFELSHPQAVFIDEAGQAQGINCNIALKGHLVRLVVMVGDDKQLPPTILSHGSRSSIMAEELRMSPFERFKLLGYPCIMLKTNYRMHPHISEGPNAIMYAKQLIDHQSVLGENTPLDKWYDGVFRPKHHTLQPYHRRKLLINVASTSEQHKFSKSSFNVRIAGTIAQLTVEMLTCRTCQPGCDAVCGPCHINPEHIGIISGYADQRQLIHRLLERQGVRGVDVRTVDGFQGQERKIILHDMTEGYKPPSERAKPVEFVGFFAEPRRLNVASTKAQRLHLGFGNWSEWERHHAAWNKSNFPTPVKFAMLLTQLVSTQSIVRQWNGPF